MVPYEGKQGLFAGLTPQGKGLLGPDDFHAPQFHRLTLKMPLSIKMKQALGNNIAVQGRACFQEKGNQVSN